MDNEKKKMKISYEYENENFLFLKQLHLLSLKHLPEHLQKMDALSTLTTRLLN